MRIFALRLIVAASIGLSGPAVAQDLGDMIGGIAQGLMQQELDRTTYIAAQNTNTAAAYRDYLTKFPRGQFRINAERALARLGAPVEGTAVSDAQIEARLSINRAQRIAVQRRLPTRTRASEVCSTLAMAGLLCGAVRKTTIEIRDPVMAAAQFWRLRRRP